MSLVVRTLFLQLIPAMLRCSALRASAPRAGPLLLASLALGGCRAAPAEERSQSGGGGQIASVVQSAVAAAGTTPPPPLGWPDLLPEEVEFEILPRKKPVVVYLDAGHGAKDNPGNTSCFCVEEQQFTLSLALDVAADLAELGVFKVVQSRGEDQLVQYSERVDKARRAGADVFVSLHSDIRGEPDEWSPDGAAICRRSVEAPGFSVLYSDEGGPQLVDARRRLADSIASAMLEAQFIPYLGAEYKGLYEPIPSETGVFVDRHEDKKRIFVLRRTTMPAVIVETHNALDPREALAFEDPIVRRLFSKALAKGILEAVDHPHEP